MTHEELARLRRIIEEHGPMHKARALPRVQSRRRALTLNHLTNVWDDFTESDDGYVGFTWQAWHETTVQGAEARARLQMEADTR